MNVLKALLYHSLNCNISQRITLKQQITFKIFLSLFSQAIILIIKFIKNVHSVKPNALF